MPMNINESIEMMRRASNEIKQLRNVIDNLAPKAEAYDLLTKVVNGLAPGRSMGVSEDVAWMLDRRADELTKELAKPAVQE